MMIGGPADGKEKKKSRLGRMRKPKSSAEGGGRQDRLQLFFFGPQEQHFSYAKDNSRERYV